jgi:hypothetical protein
MLSLNLFAVRMNLSSLTAMLIYSFEVEVELRMTVADFQRLERAS